MSSDQLKVYQDAQKASMTPREVEAMAFTKAAVMMEDLKGKEGDRQALSKALRFNHLLWTIMQADVLEPENKLPDEIKANVMSLSIFVDKQTTKAMRSGTYGDVEILVTINRNIAAGLRSDPGSGA